MKQPYEGGSRKIWWIISRMDACMYVQTGSRILVFYSFVPFTPS